MYKEITDWSEVWALLIPFFFLFRKGVKPAYLKPVKIYVILALIINIAAISIQKFKYEWGFQLGDFWFSNNFLYNIHSVIRLLLFSWFFILLNQRFMHRIKSLIPFGFILFVLINFIFFENFFNRFNLSSRLLATEAALLLFYCLQYYIFLVLEDKGIPFKKQPGIWVVIGLTFYVAASFFIFLFYDYLVIQDEFFAINVWDVHNFFYLALCICIAITFSRKNDK
ncbi:MAG TPA: hypothetical protein VGO58_13975 [Chitinophagaceae bacterium]|jgi:hypothetical protein|nr:hypothetical protein [Chitinophagaceae bacterium]